MDNTPISQEIVNRNIDALGLQDLNQASIGEIRALIDRIEKESGQSFIRMEMGIPGIKPPKIVIDAEIKALNQGFAGVYPDFRGIPPLKEEIARFAKLFLDIETSPQNCIPTVGSTHGSFTAFMVSGRRDEKKDTILLIDPGFSLHKQSVKMLGLKEESFDIYPFRGKKLKEKLESYLKKGHISTILYSSPNNPTWMCFTPGELQTIGELASKYDVVVVEDMAYFVMDFRQDFSVPGKPPFQPTVAKYTDNYILLVSSSKIFSYAGQRVGMMIVSDKLYRSDYDGLLRYYPTGNFGHSLVNCTIYAMTSGTGHTAQHGLAAVLKAVNDGSYPFTEDLKIYGEKAVVIKKMFTQNGFKLLYPVDEDEPTADGFYFCVSYPGMSGDTLIRQLLCHGISTISLASTGSDETGGVRICVSLVRKEQLSQLEEKLTLFSKNQKHQARRD